MGEDPFNEFVNGLSPELFREQFVSSLGRTKVFSKLVSGNDDLARITEKEWGVITGGFKKLGAPENLDHGQMQTLARALVARAVTRA